MKWVGEIELELEMHKQKLANECKEYNTIDAFRLIDQRGQGAVTQQEIIEFINMNFVRQGKLEYEMYDMDLFMLRFDKHDKQKIKYSEFCTAFAPQSPRAQ